MASKDLKNRQLNYINTQGAVVSYNPFNAYKPARKDEFSFVNTADAVPFAPLEEAYLVNSTWLDRWYEYVEADSENLSLHPGSIDNENLVDKATAKFSVSATFKVDFRPVKKSVWEYLFSIYGSVYVLQFQVPDIFDDKMYKKGTWAKNANFNKIEVKVIKASTESPEALLAIREVPSNSKPLGLSESLTPVEDSTRSMSFREVTVKQQIKFDVTIVGHEIKSDPIKKNVTHVIYIMQVVPPSGSSTKEWSVLRRYNEFYMLNSLLRKEKLKLPTLPGKRYFRSSTSQSFIETRQVRLEKYLHELLMLNPDIWENRSFNQFLDKNVMWFDQQPSDTHEESESAGLWCCFSKKRVENKGPSPLPSPKPIEVDVVTTGVPIASSTKLETESQGAVSNPLQKNEIRTQSPVPNASPNANLFEIAPKRDDSVAVVETASNQATPIKSTEPEIRLSPAVRTTDKSSSIAEYQTPTRENDRASRDSHDSNLRELHVLTPDRLKKNSQESKQFRSNGSITKSNEESLQDKSETMSDLESKSSSHSFLPKIRSHHRHSTTSQTPEQSFRNESKRKSLY